jgi:hypothetical protein
MAKERVRRIHGEQQQESLRVNALKFIGTYERMSKICVEKLTYCLCSVCIL